MGGRLQYILMLLLSALAVAWAAGYSYQSSYKPSELSSLGSGFHSDGWVEDEAKLYIPELAPYGNRLILKSSDWHPAGRSGIETKVSVCDEERAQILIEPSGQYAVSLQGWCEPRVVSFKFKDPFIPSEQDQRKLGAKFESVEIDSRLGIPLVSPQVLLTLLIPIGLLAAIAMRLAPPSFGFSSFISVAVLGSVLIALQDNLNLAKVVWVYFVMGAIGLGALWGRAVPEGLSSKPSLRSSTLVITIIVLLGLALRLFGLTFGLPINFHPDEVPKYNAIMRMYSDGTLNPRYFLHPSLLLYLTYGVTYLLHLIGIFGEFSEGVLLSGRIVSTVAGTISIWLVYALAKRFFSNQVALWSALILAVSPLHITCSRYVKEDALLTCMVLATAYFTARAVREDRKNLLLWAGLFAGLSASVKYSGLLSVGIVASAPWLVSGNIIPAREWIRATFFATLVFPIGFLIATPYSLIDIQKFVKDAGYEQRHMERGHTTTIDAWSQYWTFYLSRCIVPGLTWPMVLIAGCAVGAALWARNISVLWIGYLVLVFYLPSEYVKSKPAPQPDRYIMPCLPFISILAGWACARFLYLGRGALALALIVLFPLKRSVELASEIVPDTRTKMAQWIVEHIPQGEGILVDWQVYSPNLPEGRYRTEFLERSRILEELEPRNLRASGYRYLLISSFFYGRYFSQPNVEAAPRERIRDVFRKFPVVHEERAFYGSYGFHNPVVTLLEIAP